MMYATIQSPSSSVGEAVPLSNAKYTNYCALAPRGYGKVARTNIVMRLERPISPTGWGLLTKHLQN